MTQEEFKNKLAEHDIPESNYSFDGSFNNDTIVIVRYNTKWKIFYYESGNRNLLNTCTNEEEVYDFLWTDVQKNLFYIKDTDPDKGVRKVIKGFAIALIIGILLAVAFLFMVFNAFETQYDTIKIPQEIGGTLICDVEHSMDLHSWRYTINYNYQIDDTTIYLGEGRYMGREWKRNEQLNRYNDWLILKTGAYYDSDKIIIGKLGEDDWREYVFNPEIIVSEPLWNQQKIHPVLLHYSPWEVYIDSINGGNIKLHYKFRTDPHNTEELGERIINYSIHNGSGRPIMTSIKNI